MRKLLFAIITVLSFSNCTNDSQNNDILPFIPVNETINLSLPLFVNLAVPGGWAYTSGGINGIIIYNINGTQFKAFERSAPHIPSSSCSQMIVEHSIKMKCPCDNSEFNILNGAPLTAGISYSAREYLVTNLTGSVLRITNF
ncbi:MAG: nitrite reductase/ring-hydroxylating ferredoxin subunit [Polaribacter sp.]|jgi:nitrite reductase/ring-hydroxylating ferredoxin subunit